MWLTRGMSSESPTPAPEPQKPNTSDAVEATSGSSDSASTEPPITKPAPADAAPASASRPANAARPAAGKPSGQGGIKKPSQSRLIVWVLAGALGAYWLINGVIGIASN